MKQSKQLTARRARLATIQCTRAIRKLGRVHRAAHASVLAFRQLGDALLDLRHEYTVLRTRVSRGQGAPT